MSLTCNKKKSWYSPLDFFQVLPSASHRSCVLVQHVGFLHCLRHMRAYTDAFQNPKAMKCFWFTYTWCSISLTLMKIIKGLTINTKSLKRSRSGSQTCITLLKLRSWVLLLNTHFNAHLNPRRTLRLRWFSWRSLLASTWDLRAVLSRGQPASKDNVWRNSPIGRSLFIRFQIHGTRMEAS